MINLSSGLLLTGTDPSKLAAVEAQFINLQGVQSSLKIVDLPMIDGAITFVSSPAYEVEISQKNPWSQHVMLQILQFSDEIELVHVGLWPVDQRNAPRSNRSYH